MNVLDFIIFFTIFLFITANNLLPTNVSSSALRLLQCNTNTFALICDPDEVFTVFERKDLKKELQKLESRTRKFKFTGSFRGDEGVTADIIITKKLINNSSEGVTEKSVAEEILSNWYIYNSDQKGFVIVFSTSTNKFWAIKQHNVLLTNDEFVKIFDSQKLLFEKGSYKQAFSNIINAIADKAVAEMEKRNINFPSHYDDSHYSSKAKFWDMFSPDQEPPKSKSSESRQPNMTYIFIMLFFVCPVLISTGLIFAIQYFFKPSRTTTQNVTEESGQCQPPPSYSEAVGFNNNNDGMPKDDKFWDGFIAASRMMGMITDNIRTGQNIPNGYIPGVLIQGSENDVLPSAPVEDENNDKI